MKTSYIQCIFKIIGKIISDLLFSNQADLTQKPNPNGAHNPVRVYPIFCKIKQRSREEKIYRKTDRENSMSLFKLIQFYFL